MNPFKTLKQSLATLTSLHGEQLVAAAQTWKDQLVEAINIAFEGVKDQETLKTRTQALFNEPLPFFGINETVVSFEVPSNEVDDMFQNDISVADDIIEDCCRVFETMKKRFSD